MKYKNIKESFDDKYEIVEEIDCWVWIASILKMGYGCIRWDNKTHYAHRISYEIHNGEIPEGMHVLHKCDNRFCVNPDHLFLGNNQDNINDSVNKGRRKGITRNRPSGLKYNLTKKHKLSALNKMKITEDDINNIREEYSKGNTTHIKLANKYNVSDTCIYRIVNNLGLY